MNELRSVKPEPAITRAQLADLLNEDLAREYQAIIGYVVYSQVLKGPEFMNIAAQLEIHAAEVLKHALIVSRQVNYLGKMPVGRDAKDCQDVRECARDAALRSGQ